MYNFLYIFPEDTNLETLAYLCKDLEVSKFDPDNLGACKEIIEESFYNENSLADCARWYLQYRFMHDSAQLSLQELKYFVKRFSYSEYKPISAMFMGLEDTDLIPIVEEIITRFGKHKVLDETYSYKALEGKYIAIYPMSMTIMKAFPKVRIEC
jgi:hypothetical protein